MFVPTTAIEKLADENMVHFQGIGIILCCFTHYLIINPMVPVYYFIVHPTNNI